MILDILKKPIVVKSPAELKKETPEQKAEHANLVKLKTVFNDCLDEDHLDKIGTTPLLEIVDSIQTLFPAAYPKSAELVDAKTTGQTAGWWASFAELEKNAKAAVDRIIGGEMTVTSEVMEEAEVDVLQGKDKAPSRRTKLTNVLAYLHAKGQSDEHECRIGSYH